jgi:hypothetical protein
MHVKTRLSQPILSKIVAQLCIFTAHVGKTTQQQHNWQNLLHFPPFCSKSHEETMVSHWLIDSSSSALSSQHPQTLLHRRLQTLRFVPREVKNIKHDKYFPQGLERSNPRENYPHTRETCWANRLAWQLAQQVSLDRVRIVFVRIWPLEALRKISIVFEWYFSPREEKISTSADVASLVLSCLNQLANDKPCIVSSCDVEQNGGKCKRVCQLCCCWVVFPTCAVKMHSWASGHARRLAMGILISLSFHSFENGILRNLDRTRTRRKSGLEKNPDPDSKKSGLVFKKTRTWLLKTRTWNRKKRIQNKDYVYENAKVFRKDLIISNTKHDKRWATVNKIIT